MCFYSSGLLNRRGAGATSEVGHLSSIHTLPPPLNSLRKSALTAGLGGSVLVLVLVFTLFCLVGLRW